MPVNRKTLRHLHFLVVTCLALFLIGIPSDFNPIVRKKQEAGVPVFLNTRIEVETSQLASTPHILDIHQVLSEGNDGTNPHLVDVLAWLESEQHTPEKSLSVKLLSAEMLNYEVSHEYLRRIDSYLFTGFESGGYKFFQRQNSGEVDMSLWQQLSFQPSGDELRRNFLEASAAGEVLLLDQTGSILRLHDTLDTSSFLEGPRVEAVLLTDASAYQTFTTAGESLGQVVLTERSSSPFRLRRADDRNYEISLVREITDHDLGQRFLAVGFQYTDERVRSYDLVTLIPVNFMRIIIDAEICNNNLDDDGDERIDCLDDDCVTRPQYCSGTLETDCADTMDNDNNGATDCADSNCLGRPECPGIPPTEECHNAIDDDQDSQVDCSDPDCINTPECSIVPPAEDCQNGIDDDTDGFPDCSDTDCSATPECSILPPSEECQNGVDDDADGFVDCGDADCSGRPECWITPPAEECWNHLDDDGDFQIDCGDSDCTTSPECGRKEICAPATCPGTTDVFCSCLTNYWGGCECDCAGCPSERPLASPYIHGMQVLSECPSHIRVEASHEGDSVEFVVDGWQSVYHYGTYYSYADFSGLSPGAHTVVARTYRSWDGRASDLSAPFWFDINSSCVPEWPTATPTDGPTEMPTEIPTETPTGVSTDTPTVSTTTEQLTEGSYVGSLDPVFTLRLDRKVQLPLASSIRLYGTDLSTGALDDWGSVGDSEANSVSLGYDGSLLITFGTESSGIFSRYLLPNHTYHLVVNGQVTEDVTSQAYYVHNNNDPGINFLTPPLSSEPDNQIVNHEFAVALIEAVPTETPTEIPTEPPTETPTEFPTAMPTEMATQLPGETPAQTPVEVPAEIPSEIPTETPTSTPESCCVCFYGKEFLRDCWTWRDNQPDCKSGDDIALTEDTVDVQAIAKNVCEGASSVKVTVQDHATREYVGCPYAIALDFIKELPTLTDCEVMYDGCNVFDDAALAARYAQDLRTFLAQCGRTNISVTVSGNENVTTGTYNKPDNTYCTPLGFKVCSTSVKKQLSACHPEGSACATDVDNLDSRSCLDNSNRERVQVCVANGGNENNAGGGVGAGTWKFRD